MTPQERQARIEKIRAFPADLEAAVRGLSTAQMDYRPGAESWSVRQNLHHLADSHMNAFIRMKMLLTEEHPTVKPYDQVAWAELPDTRTLPPQHSFDILRGLHARWAALMESLDEAQWSRTGYHPESGEITVEGMLQSYADHCAAHLSQIAGVLRSV